MIKAFLLLLSFILTGNAWVDGYHVSNYVGHIGKYPVHLSVQKIKYGPGISALGSYYYDKQMEPIPLYGKYKSDKKLSLCATHSDADFDRFIRRGSPKGVETDGCPFQLVLNEDSAIGKWREKNQILDVALKQVGSLSDTGHRRSVVGTVEIPFWGHTLRHSFLGIYEASGDAVSFKKIKVIRKSTGHVAQEFDLQDHQDCMFGFYMTSIYENIERKLHESPAEGVALNCWGPRDAEMAYLVLDKTGIFRFEKGE